MPSEDKLIIAVDLDWCSSGLWKYEVENDRWRNLSYESVEMPEWLVARFDFWTSWMNRTDPMSDRMSKDESILFGAYGLSLALDLRRHLTEIFDEPIELRYGRQRVVPLPADAAGNAAMQRQPRALPRPMLDKIIPQSVYLKKPDELSW